MTLSHDTNERQSESVTPAQQRLLDTIEGKLPCSYYELARVLGYRSVAPVSAMVGRLELLGLVGTAMADSTTALAHPIVWKVSR